MELRSRDFGVIQISEEDVLTFVEPLYGFEKLKTFVLLQDRSLGTDFAWLQSTESPEVCFILVRTALIQKEYHLDLAEELVQKLFEKGMECLEPWCLLVIPETFQKATVNLKSPILIDPKSRRALQVVLEGEYPLRQPLIQGKKGVQ